MSMQVEGFFCEMCRKWADRVHVNSGPQLKRKRWFDDMTHEQQLSGWTISDIALRTTGRRRSKHMKLKEVELSLPLREQQALPDHMML